MGMFDYYRSSGSLECPVCHKPLHEWQGKDGPRGLFVWLQDLPGPIGCNEEFEPLPDGLAEFRLPSEFTIHSDGCKRSPAREIAWQRRVQRRGWFPERSEEHTS